jgi:hypothetical protein
MGILNWMFCSFRVPDLDTEITEPREGIRDGIERELIFGSDIHFYLRFNFQF